MAASIKEFLNIQQPVLVGLSWDEGKKDVDLDLQCVVLNDIGSVLEAVYYNQPESKTSKIQYSGDSKGHGSGFDEVITIDLRTLPLNAKYIAILSCCSQGKPANLSENSYVAVQQMDKTLFKSSLKEQGKHLAFLPTVFQKDFSGQWFSHSIKQIGDGKNFMECEALIKKGLIVAGFDHNLFEQSKSWTGDKSFRLDKENPLVLPQQISKLILGLGWKTRCDIDCSVLTFDSTNKQVDQVYFNNKTSKDGGIVHKGDNLTGEGDDKQGDDEIIEINFNSVSPKIHTIWTVITVFTEGKQFDDVRSAYCRLIDSTSNKEFCRFQLSKNKDGVSNGSIMSCISRYGDHTWAIIGKGFYTQKTRSAGFVSPIIERILRNDYSQVKFSDADTEGKPTWQLTVLRAENLGSFDVGGKSDPYVKIKLNGKKIGKTNTVMLNLNPEFNYPMQINMSVGDKVVFKILDYDRFTADDYMGSCFFEVQQSHFDEPVKEYTLKVKNKEGNDHNTYKGNLIIQLKEI